MPPLKHGSAGHLDPDDSEVICWIRDTAETDLKAAKAIFRSAYDNGAVWYDGRLAKYVGSWERLLEKNEGKFRHAVPHVEAAKPKTPKNKKPAAIAPATNPRAAILPPPPDGWHDFAVQDAFETAEGELRLKLLFQLVFTKGGKAVESNIVTNVGHADLGQFLDCVGRHPGPKGTLLIEAADVVGWHGGCRVNQGHVIEWLPPAPEE